MIKIKPAVLALLSVTSSLCYAALPTDGIYPERPGPQIPLIGSQTYDVLVDLVPRPTDPLNAFGNDGGVQGLVRNTAAVDLFNNPVPVPTGPMPLARGYQYLVAGYVYPANSLEPCTTNPTATCVPKGERIGNWLCSGLAVADPNQNPWPKGKAMSAATMMFNITQKVKDEIPYKGVFTATYFEANAFADVGTKFSAPISNGSGSFSKINEMIVVPLGFVGGDPNNFQRGIQVAFRVTVKKTNFLG